MRVLSIRVRDLPPPRPGRDLPGGGHVFARQPILKCRGDCQGEYSANPGDYWNHPADYVFRCCGRNMALVDKRTVYEAVEIHTA